MAYFEIRDGRYFAAMWMRPDDEGPYGYGADALAGLWRDGHGDRWHFTLRIRGYVDGKAWESEDQHNGWTVVHPVGTEEAAAVRKADEMMEALGFSGPVHKLILRTDRAAAISAALQRESFMHGRTERVDDPARPHGYARKPPAGST